MRSRFGYLRFEEPDRRMSEPVTARLTDLVFSGCRVALGDGAGVPTSFVPELCEVARSVGNVRLLLGWCLGGLGGLDPSAFGDVRAFMGGYALRTWIDQGLVHYIPARLQTVLKLVRGALRPDILVASIGRGRHGWSFTTEVGWQRAAVEAGAIVAAVYRPTLPVCDAGSPIPDSQIRMLGTDTTEPFAQTWAPPSDVHRAVGRHVAPFVSAGDRLQFAPGPLGSAILECLSVPIRVDTGVITDAVSQLHQQGRLIDTPIAPYLVGSAALYEWAKGRNVLQGLEVTHHQARLSTGAPFVSIATALEVDADGQINVESVSGSTIAGIGGQPDYAFAAASAITGGLSILAVTTRSGKHSTRVERLGAPTSTPSHDIDVIVTENGSADLRGLDRRERRLAIERLWTTRAI